MKIRISISRAILAFGALTALGLATMVFTSGYALNQLRIGGPLYSQIKLGNDLVADILPPPVYVIEAYLDTTLALRDGAEFSVHERRLKELHKDYTDRRRFWANSSLHPAMKEKLAIKSDGEVQKFWSIIEQEILPALSKKDKGSAERAYAKLQPVYAAHRAVIDDVVKQANAENAELEDFANKRVTTFSLVVWVVSGVVVLLIAGGILAIAIGMVRPIVRLTEAMVEMAAGSLSSVIPGTGRRDEIGGMANAVMTIRANAERRHATRPKLRSSRIGLQDNYARPI